MRVPLSVKQYALMISLLTVGLLLLFGWVSQHQIEKSEAEISAWKQDLSDQELDKALRNLNDKALAIANNFSEWQEVRQQLSKPEYYSYWKKHRVKNSSLLPRDVLDVVIYDRSGKLLRPQEVPTFVEQLPKPLPQPCVSVRAGNLAVLTIFHEVLQPQSKKVLGYVGIQLPLFSYLLDMSHFSFIDKANLKLNIREGEEVGLLKSKGYFSYQLAQDIVSQAMDSYVKDTTKRLMLIGLILSVTLYIYLAFVVAAPISMLMEHIKKLREDKDLRPKEFIQPLALKEMDDIRLLLNQYHARLDDIHRDLDRTNKELWQQARHDPLTGINNRRAFNEYWEKIQQQFSQQGDCLSLMIIDVNHFKAINDSYGHRTGDNVLKGIVESLSSELKNEQRLFRLGGDEFAYVHTELEESDVVRLAENCCRLVSQYDFFALGVAEPVKISVGIAIVGSDNQEKTSDMIRQADVAIYQAKRPGSSGIVVYSSAIANMTQNLFSSKIYNAVYQAIETGEGLTMFYQPIVRLEDRRICYYEALVRIHYDDELIYPDSIFPIIEARNLEQELDQAIIKQVASDLSKGKIPAGTGVSVNLSAASVARHDVATWFEPLEAFLSSHDIVIEVTETALITQMEKATDNLEQLSEKGFRVALDDFGSGYSSVRYLSCMPVNIVKFDITLIHDLDNESQKPIITGLSEIISNQGYSMVAEGVEDQRTCDNAIAAGFKYAQGFLFGRPEPIPQEKVNEA